MKALSLTIAIAILTSSCSNGQNNSARNTQNNHTISKEFYKNGTNLQSKSEYDSFISNTNRRLDGKDFQVIPEILSELHYGDSIIYVVKLNIRTTHNKMIGKKLPDFNFTDIEGKLVSLKDLIGKPIVINFWFVECPPCIAEMPSLNSIKERYSSSDIQFLSMTYESKEEVIKFLKKTKINWRIIPNIEGYSQILASNFPQTIFINRQGIITDIQNGIAPVNDKQLKATPEKMEDADFINSLNAIK